MEESALSQSPHCGNSGQDAEGDSAAGDFLAQDGALAEQADASRQSGGSRLSWPSSANAMVNAARTSMITSGWKKFSGRGDGDDSYRFGDVTRGLVKEAIPSIRENIHKLKMGACDVKESFHDKKSEFVKKAVSTFDVGDSEDMAFDNMKSTKAKEKRWWAQACAAAHVPHDAADDAPVPPERARVPAISSTAPAAATDSDTAICSTIEEVEARGCLEIEVQAFSDTLKRPDGNLATNPLCQLAFGGRCTGALRIPSHKEDFTADDTADGQPTSRSIARFAVNEVVNCDVRLHVFDSDCTKFNLGLEEQAFCGGALVPLMGLYRKVGFDVNELGNRVLDTTAAVRLVPLEFVRDKNKYEPAKENASGPKADLGHVLLKFKLTLYDTTPINLYTAVPFRGEPSVGLQASVTVGDDPMTVLVATFTALQRVFEALDFSNWFAAADRLRERVVTSLALHCLWSLAVFTDGTWRLPGYASVAAAMFVWEVSRVSTEQVSLRLFNYEPEAAKSYRERGKKGIQNALKMDLALIKMAHSATEFARRVEKVKFVLTLRDPYLSMWVGGTVGVLVIGATVFLRIYTLLFGKVGISFLIWSAGCIGLLPRAWRQQVVATALALKAEMERKYGKGKLIDMIIKRLSSFWERIPDIIESRHLELFERDVCLP